MRTQIRSDVSDNCLEWSQATPKHSRMDSLVIVDFTHFKKTFSAFSKSKIIDRLSLSLSSLLQEHSQVGKWESRQRSVTRRLISHRGILPISQKNKQIRILFKTQHYLFN